MTRILCDRCKEVVKLRAPSSSRSENGSIVLWKGDDIHLCDDCTTAFQEWLQATEVVHGN